MTFTKRNRLLVVAIVAVLTITAFVLLAYPERKTSDESTTVHAKTKVEWVAGPGLVEPLGEDLRLGTELSGKLRSVNVSEGDSIHKGQVLAILENDDYLAQVRSAKADVLAKESTLRKVV